MATVIYIPQELHFSLNIPSIKLSSTTSVQFYLQNEQEESLVEEIYYPDAQNEITIDIREVVHSSMENFFPVVGGMTSFPPSEFTFYIDNKQYYFYAIKGRLKSRPINTNMWLMNKPLLSLSAGVKRTSVNCPEFMTLYPQQDTDVIVKCGPISTCLYTLKANQVHTVDVSYAIHGLATDFEVYLGSQLVRTYEVRNYLYEYYFLFQNTLGGFDSILMTGEKEEQPMMTYKSVRQGDYSTNYHTELVETTEQNSGYFLSNEAAHYINFLEARKQWKLDKQGELYSIVLSDKARPQIGDADRGLHSYKFSYEKASEPFMSFPQVKKLIAIQSAGVFPTDHLNNTIHQVVWN